MPLVSILHNDSVNTPNERSTTEPVTLTISFSSVAQVKDTLLTLEAVIAVSLKVLDCSGCGRYSDDEILHGVKQLMGVLGLSLGPPGR